MPRLLLYVSGHGFGHAMRTRALLGALRARAGPSLELCVRSEAPHWIFTDRDPAVRCSAAPIDPGVAQRSGLDLDLPATLEAHRRFVAAWAGGLERETRFVAECSPDLVVVDIAPLAFAAAARAGVPAVGVANFSWDWIFEPWAADDARWTPIAERYREAYSLARALYRLPLHGDLGAFGRVVDVPFVVNRSARSRAACRAALGAGEDGRRLVLVSSGGFGSGPIDASDGDALDAYRFVGIGPRPPGFAGDWIALPSPSRLAHEDLVHASDAILGKTGYSTIAEAAAHGARYLYPPRGDFRECEVLEREVGKLCCARSIPRGDFAAGRWREHLDALFETPAPPSTGAVRFDGAEVLARALLEALDS